MWKDARVSPFNGLASPETSPRRKGAPRNCLSQESACHGPPLVRSTRRCAQAVGEVPFLRAPTDCQKATPSSSVQLHVINSNSTPCGVCIASRHTPVCRWKAVSSHRKPANTVPANAHNAGFYWGQFRGNGPGRPNGKKAQLCLDAYATHVRPRRLALRLHSPELSGLVMEGRLR